FFAEGIMARWPASGVAMVALLLLLPAAGCRERVPPQNAEAKAPDNEQPAVKMVVRFPRHLLKLDASPPFHVVEINLVDNPVTDADLQELKELKRLRYLIVNRTPITDAGVKGLKDLKELQTLGRC